MWIKLLASRSGFRRAYNRGEEVDWKPDAEARRLIAAGDAVAVRSAEVETTSVAPPAEDETVEKATARTPRRTTRARTTRTTRTPAKKAN